jgi:uncharacterized protein YjiS (DUF1127 family)
LVHALGEEVDMSVDAVPAARVSRRDRVLEKLASVAVARLLRWHELTRQRRTLRTLDDRMLKDIGVTRADAEREAGRPFWRDALDP